MTLIKHVSSVHEKLSYPFRGSLCLVPVLVSVFLSDVDDL